MKTTQTQTPTQPQPQTITKLEIGKLVFNEALTDLRPINSVFVSRYRQNYRAGIIMPPLIVAKKTHTIVSGNTRATALLQEYPPEYEIDVITKTYKGWRDILEEFVKENISHGNPLTGISRRRIALALIDAGAAPEEVATTFGVAVKRIDEMGNFMVAVIGKRKKKEYKPIKRGPALEGKTITAEQYSQHLKQDIGLKVAEMSDQLTRWVQAGWVEEEEDIEALRGLCEVLKGFLKGK